MDKRKRWWSRLYVLLGITFISFAGIYFTLHHRPILSSRDKPSWTKFFQESQEAFGNPKMGFVSSARNRALAQKTSLVYVDVTWRELEPEEGKYAWDHVETRNSWQEWKKQGKAVVLRFVLDKPGEEAHIDVPDWLVKKMKDPGDVYDGRYGKGFSPNYEDEQLQQAYARVVEAMGQRWGTDSFVAFVELGGLGHWGEWHVNKAMGIRSLPREAVRESFIKPWIGAFPLSQILMRRPFKAAQKYGFGLYHDMFGHEESTDEWLSWLERGGDFHQTLERDALVPMPNAWESKAVGGELTSSYPMEELLTSRLKSLQSHLQKAHATFLGPKIPYLNEADQEEASKYILRYLGYRLWVKELRMQDRSVVLNLTNTGVAPFYFDWPLYVLVEDETGKEVRRQKVHMDVRTLLPERSKEVSVPMPDNLPEHYVVKLIMVDPETGKAAVHFAVEGQEEQFYQELYRK